MRRPPLALPLCPPALCFVGPSGIGKTTLLEQLIARLSAEGIRVAAIKHDAHEFAIDHAGKDSHRLRCAGAQAVAISSQSQAAFVAAIPRPLSLPELVARIPVEVDLVLVEGHKQSDAPKIELHRLGLPVLAERTDLSGFVAIVTDDPKAAPHLVRFVPGDLDAITHFARMFIE